MANHQPFEPVANVATETYAPGEALANPQKGDFLLTHGDAWTSTLIRFGQRLRFRGDDRPYARWNHAVLLVDNAGTIVEALGGGVTRRHIDVYAGTEYTHVPVASVIASESDRDQIAVFGEWAVGQPYGFVTIVSIAYGLLTGGKFTFGFDGQAICSGLVARSLERSTAIFNRTPSHIMPADLAKYFQVDVPGPETPRGTIPPRA